MGLLFILLNMMRKPFYILTALLCVALTGCLDSRKPMASSLVKGVLFGKFVGQNDKFEIDHKQTSFSRSKGDNYCWLAVLKDGQSGKTLKVTETFELPAQGSFTSDAEHKIESSDDGKTWTVTMMQDTGKDTPVVTNCWVATADDPLGDYRLTVDIDGEFQHTFKFSMVQ